MDPLFFQNSTQIIAIFYSLTAQSYNKTNKIKLKDLTNHLTITSHIPQSSSILSQGSVDKAKITPNTDSHDTSDTIPPSHFLAV